MALNHNAKTYAEASFDLIVFANGLSEKSELVLCVGIVSEDDLKAFDEINQDHKIIVRCKTPEAAYQLKKQLLTQDREGKIEDEEGSGDYVYAYSKPDPANPNA